MALVFSYAGVKFLAWWAESGCGKTTTGRVILRAYQPTAGEIIFQDEEAGEVDLARLSRDEMRPVWQHIQLIFQDPYSSLNPRMTLEQIVGEPLRNYGCMRGSALRDRVAELMGWSACAGIHVAVSARV